MIERKHRRRPSRAWIVISNNVLTRRMTREAQKESHETNRPTRQADALPDGMAIVPVEPTDEMIDYAERMDWSIPDSRAVVINIWQAMLAAAKEKQS